MKEKLIDLFNHYYKKDGGKITLYLPYVYWTGGILFGIFIVFQLCLPDTERLSAPDPISTPQLTSDAVSFPSIAASEDSPERSEAKVSRGNKKKLTYSGPQVILRPRNLGAIQPGAMLEAVLVTGAASGLVKAKAKERLIINGETLIESGTLLIGQATSGEERLGITFSQAIFADGTMGQINAVAADKDDKIVGIKGSAWGSKTLSIAGSVGLGFVGGISEGLQDTQGQQGVMIRRPTWRNALLNATSATAFEQSRNIMQGLKDNHPTIEISPNTSIIVIFGGAQ